MDNIRLRQRRLQPKRPNGEQACHRPANATMHQPNRRRNNNRTTNRPHAIQRTPNQGDMQLSKWERHPPGWRYYGVPHLPTTIPTDTTEHRNSIILQLTSQPQQPTPDPRPPGRAQAQPSQEA